MIKMEVIIKKFTIVLMLLLVTVGVFGEEKDKKTLLV